MKRIKKRNLENNIKTFDMIQDISCKTRTVYDKSNRIKDKYINESSENTNEYVNELQKDFANETLSSANLFVKNNLKKSVQKKRALNSERRANAIKSKDIPVRNMHMNNAPLNNIASQKSMAEKVKDRFVRNRIKTKSVGATKIQEKIIGFIKNGPVAAINTAKRAIANTKILFAALIGTGGVAILFTITICIIGLVMGSSFGIFMATEDTGTGYTLNTVIQEINEEYLEEIEKIKDEVSHDDFEISDTTPNWKHILAVYAVKVTTAHEGAEVVTIDEVKAELIREVFWDMTEIIYETESYEDTDIIETTDEQGNTVEQEITIIKTRLFIDIQNKTIDEAVINYDFNEDEIMQLQELLKADNGNMWEFII